MRWRVDTGFDGFASFSEEDEEKAWELYNNLKQDSNRSEIRIRICEDIFDEGTVIAGPPIVEDWTKEWQVKE